MLDLPPLTLCNKIESYAVKKIIGRNINGLPMDLKKAKLQVNKCSLFTSSYRSTKQEVNKSRKKKDGGRITLEVLH